MKNLKLVLLLLSSILLICACKTGKEFQTSNLLKLEISQSKALTANDSTYYKKDSAIVFTASQDSVGVMFDEQPVNFSLVKTKENSNIFTDKKPDFKASLKENHLKMGTLITSKTWNILVSVVVFLAGIIAFLTIPYTGLAIILMALGIILFILAMEKFPAPEEPQYQNPDSVDEPKKPMNRYAKFALAFFLLSILLLLTIFLELTLFVLAPFTFLGAVIFAISALIDIKQKNGSEEGKSLSTLILVISSLPLLLVLVLFVLVLIYGIGE